MKRGTSPTRRDWTGPIVAVALFASIVVFVALVYGLGSDNDLYRSYDFREIFRYQKAYYSAALLAGRLPLWTPHTFSGWPFAANPLTQTFYPPALLALVLAPPTFAAVDLILHLALAAVGTSLLLRRSFGLCSGAAAFGGLAYACSGPLVAHAYAGHIPYYAAAAYVPWMLFAADRATARGRVAVPWVASGALVLGLQILSGGLPFVWLTLALLVLYRIAERLCRGPRGARVFLAEVVAVGAIVVGGLGLGAVQLVPTAELALLSNRIDAGWEYAAEGSLPIALVPALVFPEMPANAEKGVWEFYSYLGALPLLLALAGVLRLRKEKRVIGLLAIATLSLVFALGKNAMLFAFLWSHVPGFSLFREPARALLVVGFAISLTAAIGLDGATVLIARRSRALAGALAALACVVTVGDVTRAARLNRERLQVREQPGLVDGVHPQFSRVLERDRSWYRYWFPRAFFRENHAYAMNARSVGGYDNLFLARYGRFANFMTDTPPTPTLVTILDPHMFLNRKSNFPFHVLGVKYTYAIDQTLRASPRLVHRAWFVTRACRVADEHAALERMRAVDFDPEAEALFEPPDADALAIGEAACAGEKGPDVDVGVEELSPERLRISLGPHPKGFVVLSEMYYPGWRASAGGRAVSILRSDSILRALPVDAADTAIDMDFAPASLRWGAWITAATLLVMTAAVASSRAHR